jgi:hypothetical protein
MTLLSGLPVISEWIIIIIVLAIIYFVIKLARRMLK